MSNTDEPMGRLITFRAPENLATAMETAAAKQFCSVSVIARSAVAEAMRERGLLSENESA
jgi:hypothetical protein